MRFSPWSFIVDQWSQQPPVIQVDLTGKTVVVVGANTGLGFEAARHFATMTPGRLILACRSQSKGQAALDSKLLAIFFCFNRGFDQLIPRH
jgi:cobalamin biosynthesis protein CbiG